MRHRGAGRGPAAAAGRAGHGAPVWETTPEAGDPKRPGERGVIIHPGSDNVIQLFIPGLRDHRRNLPTPLCQAALDVRQPLLRIQDCFDMRRKPGNRRKLPAWARGGM